jgi:hypothetical protein
MFSCAPPGFCFGQKPRNSTFPQNPNSGPPCPSTALFVSPVVVWMSKSMSKSPTCVKCASFTGGPTVTSSSSSTQKTAPTSSRSGARPRDGGSSSTVEPFSSHRK